MVTQGSGRSAHCAAVSDTVPCGGGGRVLHGFYLEQTLFPEIWGEVTVLEEHVARGSPPSCDRSNGGLGQL